jgi:lipopolysaccharide assembly protein A
MRVASESAPVRREAPPLAEGDRQSLLGPTQAPPRNGPLPIPVQPGTPLASPPSAAEPGRRSRHLWLGLIPGLLALVMMLVFIFQKLRETTVGFFGFSGGAPLGLTLVAAALLGGIIVFGLGPVRIVQLRKLARAQGRRP